MRAQNTSFKYIANLDLIVGIDICAIAVDTYKNLFRNTDTSLSNMINAAPPYFAFAIFVFAYEHPPRGRQFVIGVWASSIGSPQ